MLAALLCVFHNPEPRVHSHHGGSARGGEGRGVGGADGVEQVVESLVLCGDACSALVGAWICLEAVSRPVLMMPPAPHSSPDDGTAKFAAEVEMEGEIAPGGGAEEGHGGLEEGHKALEEEGHQARGSGVDGCGFRLSHTLVASLKALVERRRHSGGWGASVVFAAGCILLNVPKAREGQGRDETHESAHELMPVLLSGNSMFLGGGSV
jgi:hypothetical protein